MNDDETILVRRTVPTDYTERPWLAVIDVTDTLAASFVVPSTPAGNRRIVKAFGNSPEHALEQCYLSIGKRACLELPKPESSPK